MRLIKKLKSKFDRSHRVNLFIIGAQKAGTTSLYNYLVQHCSIKGSNPKEVDFFSYDINYEKGSKWYHKHFQNDIREGGFYYLDASVEYMYIPNTWKRIKKYNPNAKIIVLLRDPVDRAYSAYHMYKKLNEGYGLNYYINHIQGHNPYYKSQMLRLLKSNDFLSFDDYIDMEMELQFREDQQFWYEPSFLNRGIYYRQLKPYLMNFNEDNILILDSVQLRFDKIKILNGIFEWLGLDKTEDYDLGKNYLVGDYTRTNNEAIDHKIKTFFKHHNEMLFDLIDKDFNWL